MQKGAKNPEVPAPITEAPAPKRQAKQAEGVKGKRGKAAAKQESAAPEDEEKSATC